MTALVDMPQAAATLQAGGDGEVPSVPVNGIKHASVTTVEVEPSEQPKRAAVPVELADSPFALRDQYGYTPRKVKVFTVGAGFSGLLMAHKFQHRFPEMQDIVEHTIFEAHSDVGGTWLVNNYPGVQCDVPAHIYVSSLGFHHGLVLTGTMTKAFPFDPNPNWDRFYANGADILAYIKRTVKKWNLDRDLQLNTRVLSAAWQEEKGQWKVTLEHEGKQRDEYCDVLISAQGVLV
jgi:cation diffusion facilitator CzcD-associated flavoprotein CzcO